MQFWRYKRILCESKVKHACSDDVDEFSRKLKRIHEDSRIPAGYTYFGQFINHDLSFMDITDTMREGHESIDPDDLVQRRRAALDLDSMYGSGLDDSHVPYDGATGKFQLGTKTFKYEMPRDLPRQHDHIAQIADPRNDENMIIAQLQVLFMNFHNRVVDHYRKHGFRGGKKLFHMARSEVIKTYVDLVLHDFARRLLPDAVYQTVIVKKKGLISKANQESPTLAVEFATAAFRLHSMVREGYVIQRGVRRSLNELLRFTGKYAHFNQDDRDPEKKFFPLPDYMVIDWRMFFEIVGDPAWRPVKAKPLSPYVSLFDPDQNTLGLHDIKNKEDEPIDLYWRSIMRGLQLGLPTGQEVIEFLMQPDNFPDIAKEIGLKKMKSDLLDNLGSENTLRERTPLWLYLMLEARGYKPTNFGKIRLGELGGWLVADTLVTAAMSVDLPGLQEWNPADSVIFHDCDSEKHGDTDGAHITFKDLLLFTYPEDFLMPI